MVFWPGCPKLGIQFYNFLCVEDHNDGKMSLSPTGTSAPSSLVLNRVGSLAYFCPK